MLKLEKKKDCFKLIQNTHTLKVEHTTTIVQHAKMNELFITNDVDGTPAHQLL